MVWIEIYWNLEVIVFIFRYDIDLSNISSWLSRSNHLLCRFSSIFKIIKNIRIMIYLRLLYHLSLRQRIDHLVIDLIGSSNQCFGQHLLMIFLRVFYLNFSCWCIYLVTCHYVIFRRGLFDWFGWFIIVRSVLMFLRMIVIYSFLIMIYSYRDDYVLIIPMNSSMKVLDLFYSIYIYYHWIHCLLRLALILVVGCLVV